MKIDTEKTKNKPEKKGTEKERTPLKRKTKIGIAMFISASLNIISYAPLKGFLSFLMPLLTILIVEEKNFSLWIGRRYDDVSLWYKKRKKKKHRNSLEKKIRLNEDDLIKKYTKVLKDPKKTRDIQEHSRIELLQIEANRENRKKREIAELEKELEECLKHKND
ncbi:MAG: hypothetical protein HQK88_06785 [Nitrospirae bacterium]|nr:hypothetical protein [Nitrospirota bacterium]MBF0536612.1 hypothetical protein [Nitrospirota bacterium]MBF0616507.1 hypothetical protein [Nitrospirota bacterium]